MQKDKVIIDFLSDFLIFHPLSSTASRTAGQRRPAETPPKQKTGPDGGSGPDPDPHH